MTVSADWIDRFGGKLVLALLDNKFEPAIKTGRSLWGLHDPLRYRPSNGDHDVTAPPGFVTDLTSIPQFAWSLLPPDGPWVKAAVIHDFLYATSGTGHWKRYDQGRTRAEPYSREEADWILRDALRNRSVGVVRRNVIWAACRLGGGGGWGKDDSRQKRVTSDDEQFITE